MADEDRRELPESRTCPICGEGKGAQFPTCPAVECRRRLQELAEQVQVLARPFFVYLLRLERPGGLYVGSTGNLRRRIDDHRRGRTSSTRGRNPRLLWFLSFPTRAGAAAAEIAVRRLSTREKQLLAVDLQDVVRELDYS